MNKYFLKNKKTGQIACPIYDHKRSVIYLLEIIRYH